MSLGLSRQPLYPPIGPFIVGSLVTSFTQFVISTRGTLQPLSTSFYSYASRKPFCLYDPASHDLCLTHRLVSPDPSLFFCLRRQKSTTLVFPFSLFLLNLNPIDRDQPCPLEIFLCRRIYAFTRSSLPLYLPSPPSRLGSTAQRSFLSSLPVTGPPTTYHPSRTERWRTKNISVQ